LKTISIFLLTFLSVFSLEGTCPCCIEVKKLLIQRVSQLEEMLAKELEWQVNYYHLEGDIQGTKFAIELIKHKCNPNIKKRKF